MWKRPFSRICSISLRFRGSYITTYTALRFSSYHRIYIETVTFSYSTVKNFCKIFDVNRMFSCKINLLFLMFSPYKITAKRVFHIRLFRACPQFYYAGPKTLISCAPLLTYFYVCSATVLRNQRFLTQPSELMTYPPHPWKRPFSRICSISLRYR